MFAGVAFITNESRTQRIKMESGFRGHRTALPVLFSNIKNYLRKNDPTRIGTNTRLLLTYVVFFIYGLNKRFGKAVLNMLIRKIKIYV